MKTIIGLAILMLTPPWLLAIILLLWLFFKYDAWKKSRPFQRFCFSVGRLCAAR